jgi:DNA polymerase II small subunit/DNA polymerase delta subunit B
MASKKTNYISYELKRLEKYYKQLDDYLATNPPNKAEDRLDVRYSQNGNPIVKVIASKESQVKLFSEQLQKLPSILEAINNLRKIADSESVSVEKARGDKEIPGIFRNRMLTQGNEDTKVDHTPDEPEDIRSDDDYDEVEEL